MATERMRKKYIVSVTEEIEHIYEIEAESKEIAEEIFYSYEDDQLKDLDLGGAITWGKPWDISEDED